MRAAAEHTWGATGLAGRTVGVEGAGKVGVHLVGLLIGAGASVQVTDVDAAARARLVELHPDVRIVDSVIDAEVDVYAPCALGATLNEDTVSRLRATVVCGGGEQPAGDPRRGRRAAPPRGAVGSRLHRQRRRADPGGRRAHAATDDQVLADTARIAETVTDLLDLARQHDSTTSTAARTLVEQRLAAARA